MNKQQRKVYHVEVKATGKHYYFGSQAAIFDVLTEEQTGITAYKLWTQHDFIIGPYQNDKVIIRFGYLQSKEGRRGRNP